MPVYTWNAIYLGNFSDIDTDEGSMQAENENLLLGHHGSAAAPLKDNVVEVVANDSDGDTNLNRNNAGPAESMTIDGVAKQLDSGVVGNATITYTDGTTAVVTVVLAQTTDGDVYLLPEMSNNADTAAYEAKPIQSIEVTSITVDTTNIAANRYQTNFICFAAGTRIAVPGGWRRVEDLRVGDAVATADRGPQAIRWITRRTVPVSARSAPIEIAAGALGAGYPQRTLRVSPQHRMLVRSGIAAEMFGTPEVLVPARKLLPMPGVRVVEDLDRVTYVHFLFDEHEIVFAEGAPTESFLPGPHGIATLDAASLASLIAAVPDLASGMAMPRPARPVAHGPRQQRLAERHAALGRPLISPADLPSALKPARVAA